MSNTTKAKPITIYAIPGREGEYQCALSDEMYDRLQTAEKGGKIIVRILTADKKNTEFKNPCDGFINFRTAAETAEAKAKWEAKKASGYKTDSDVSKSDDL